MPCTDDFVARFPALSLSPQRRILLQIMAVLGERLSTGLSVPGDVCGERDSRGVSEEQYELHCVLLFHTEGDPGGGGDGRPCREVPLHLTLEPETTETVYTLFSQYHCNIRYEISSRLDIVLTLSSSKNMTARFVVGFITHQSKDHAVALATKLVEERLVACVNVVPQITSVYRWKGEIQNDEESLMIMKTSADLQDRVSFVTPFRIFRTH